MKYQVTLNGFIEMDGDQVLPSAGVIANNPPPKKKSPNMWNQFLSYVKNRDGISHADAMKKYSKGSPDHAEYIKWKQQNEGTEFKMVSVPPNASPEGGEFKMDPVPPQAELPAETAKSERSVKSVKSKRLDDEESVLSGGSIPHFEGRKEGFETPQQDMKRWKQFSSRFKNMSPEDIHKKYGIGMPRRYEYLIWLEDTIKEERRRRAALKKKKKQEEREQQEEDIGHSKVNE